MDEDQKAIWEASYRKFLDSRAKFDDTPSDFAIEVALLLKPGQRVLELGCGTGSDAAYFARAGHATVAVDHSAAAIEIATRQFDSLVTTGSLRFMALDVAQRLPIGDAVFNCVYARLSLHYFSDEVTRAVFREIARVLTKDGLLAFICKSVDDPLYGKGRRIAEHVFESHHIRHFFSAEYARDCMAQHFDVTSLESVRGELYGEESAYVKATALRK